MLRQSALCGALCILRVRKFVRVLAAAMLATAAFAPGAIAGDVAKADGTPVDPKTWTGFGWGLGIAADFDLGGKRVTGATIDTVPGGTIVRVTDTSGNVGVGFVLEAHYFFAEWDTGFPTPKKCTGYNCNNIATGPFVAVEIGGGTAANTDAGPITGYALGWMVGLHHPSAPATSSWNFGIGLRVDPKAKVLGDGVLPNQAPPPGITTADQLLKTEPRYGIMLLSSFSF
ncbi:MAG: hypothetical protein ACTHJS_00155 [Xanthobacteraceae bacterium]